MSVLLMRLAGPMQSWGTQSRFSIRDTGLEPSKSGVVGLLCAALGKPRDESLRPDLPKLADLVSLRMAVRVDRPGTMAVDYHTARDIIKANATPGKQPARGDIKECEPSRRYYLADADFLVALQGEESLLRVLQQGLRQPVWPLFLGRKSFVPSMPVNAAEDLSPDASLPDILKSQPWWKRSFRESPTDPLRIMQETDYSPDGEVRHDVPLNFVSEHRHFTARRVMDVGLWKVPDHLIKEWPPCS